jgi:hypothetical protein
VQTIAEAWALAEDIVLDITYIQMNTEGIPPGYDGADGTRPTV